MNLRSIALVCAVSGAAYSQAALWNWTIQMDAAQHGLNTTTYPGVASGFGTYNDATNWLVIGGMSGTGLSGNINVSHIHRGGLGVAGPVQTDLGGMAPGRWTGTPAAFSYTPRIFLIQESDEVDMLVGLRYINLHTPANPGGEIRGQLIFTPVPEPVSAIVLAVGAGLLALRRRSR